MSWSHAWFAVIVAEMAVCLWVAAELLAYALRTGT